MEKTRRFHCSNSNRCLSAEQLCDGVNDCGESIDDDEAALCPWLNDFSRIDILQGPHFTCRDGTRIDITKRCNRRSDCPGNQEEDELFCDFEEHAGGSLLQDFSSLLSDIIVYPPSSPYLMAVTANTEVTTHESRSREKSNIILEPTHVRS